ncbi:BZ3500_MvSof-1268-A1-R1_Chr12-3g04050 [Microbotryum saponariae]|uniref:BZ3500_MvSof-1268-A1-R1_Chr12-3g04050 protein n=1 Tax=Microbotryum saponariae TaxID=289078 RepID=A0A2X0L798_9BASI|nr:BZ3500_MvSof-1268-A1-R1_Chr12-3g04050 [Microbotryum saponariae]SDA02604.1 BZ3501_MvSof-1269-A2-R1_Chr12-3g03705 [Microbotryum saponariae]
MALSTSILAVAASQELVVASHLALFRRADASETSSSYLANILGMAPSACADSCNTATTDYSVRAPDTQETLVGFAAVLCAALGSRGLASDRQIATAPWERNSQCANQTSQSSVAMCACSAQSLGDLRQSFSSGRGPCQRYPICTAKADCNSPRAHLAKLGTCANCIANNGNATAKSSAVSNYNSFVDLCVKDGLATVTGTVSVGQSTSAIPRATTTLASSASRAVYTTAGSVSAVPVASLAGNSSAGSATAMATATATGSAAPASATTAKSGAGRLISSGLGAVLVVALRLLA